MHFKNAFANNKIVGGGALLKKSVWIKKKTTNFLQIDLILYVIGCMVNNSTHMGLICLLQYERLPGKLLFER